MGLFYHGHMIDERRFGTVTKRCARVLTNESVVCSRRRRLAQLGLAHKRVARATESRAAPLIAGCGFGGVRPVEKFGRRWWAAVADAQGSDAAGNLRKLLEPATLGDPMRPLLWVSKSHAKLAAALRDMGIAFQRAGFLNCSNASAIAVKSTARARKADAIPIGTRNSSTSTRKSKRIRRRPVGDLGRHQEKRTDWRIQERGSDYQPQGRPLDVNVHDFIDKELGKAIPYGVYDIGANAGCVSVGIDHDTAEFAVNASGAGSRRWTREIPNLRSLMITADGGGSNGSRVRLWKIEIAKARRRDRLTIGVCHYRRHVEMEQDRASPVLSHYANWRGVL